jgi:uncharacterized protein YecT (DUF1311 family)
VPIAVRGEDAVIKVALASALLLALPHAALAEEDCSVLAQQDMNRCMGRKFDAADARLNAAYKQIVSRLKDRPDTMKMLVTAQRAWVAFRDAECIFKASSYEGGSAYASAWEACRIILTDDRTKQLTAHLNCGAADCPVPVAD